MQNYFNTTNLLFYDYTNYFSYTIYVKVNIALRNIFFKFRHYPCELIIYKKTTFVRQVAEIIKESDPH